MSDEAPNEYTELETTNPEEFGRVKTLIRNVSEVSEGLSKDIAQAMLRDPAFQNLLVEQLRGGESRQLERVEKAVKDFVSIFPLAMQININPILSVLSLHSSITGDPLIGQVIDRLNEETLGINPELREEE